jgi:protein-disulfide isomerase
MHGKLFAEPSEWDTTPEEAKAAFSRYAEVLQLDPAALMQCVEQERFAEEVARDSREAMRLGLNATPAFIINGKLMTGARPTEQFIQVLDRELGRLKQS